MTAPVAGIYPSPFLTDPWNATGNPNIRLWAEAAQAHGARVAGLDAADVLHPERARDKGADLIHLNWPEAFFNAFWAEVPAPLRLLAPERPVRRRMDAWIERLADCGLPLVLQVHELASHAFRPGSARGRLDRHMRQALWNIAAAAATQEESGARALAKAFGGDKPVHVTPLGDYARVHGPAVDRNEARERLGIAATGRVLGAIGTVRPQRNPDRVLKAFRRLAGPGDVLLIAGQGAERYQRAGGARVRVLSGFVPVATMRDVYCALDLAINDSPDYFTSGVVRTAMSYRVPVLAHAFGNTIDMAAKAMISIENTPGGLEKALARCLSMPEAELAGLRKQAGLRDAERTWDHAGQVLARLYESVLPDRRTAVEE